LAGFRFPPEVIMVAVRWHLRYGLSYRHVEELWPSSASKSTTCPCSLDTAVHAAVDRCGATASAGTQDRWFGDETYVKITGWCAYPGCGRCAV
jgi:IS6 family transposase